METKDRLKIALDNIGYDKNDSTNKNIVFNSNLEYMIKVDNIEVSYDNDFKLHDISLKIKEKEKVAIIGSNGCGKSTLLKTLAGLLDPKKGTITYGIDDMKGIRYYSQDTVLFDRSIYENIVYPNNSYSLKEVMKIVKRVKLDSLIGNEEDLFSKQPGDFGTNFSGGEKQKILLARALINKAGIMMFDEIESALDKDSEKIFIDILNNELRDSTVICVTHNNINNEVFDKKYDLNKMLFTP